MANYRSFQSTIRPLRKPPGEGYIKRYSGTRARRQEVAEKLIDAGQYRLMLEKFKSISSLL